MQRAVLHPAREVISMWLSKRLQVPFSRVTIAPGEPSTVTVGESPPGDHWVTRQGFEAPSPAPKPIRA